MSTVIHPVCLEWITRSIQKMNDTLVKARRQKKTIDKELMLHAFVGMVGIDIPNHCDCDEIGLGDEVLLSMHQNHGAVNKFYWERLQANKLLPYLAAAASHDLTTEDPELPGYGMVAEKVWMKDVLMTFLVREPDQKWFASNK